MNYSITKDSGVQAYIQLYNHFVQDIVAGVYPYGSRLPSKRIIAAETGISLVTVEHTMNLLNDEGYIEARQRSGYYVIYREADFQVNPEIRQKELPKAHLSMHHVGEFPFSVLARTMRRVLLDYGEITKQRVSGAQDSDLFLPWQEPRDPGAAKTDHYRIRCGISLWDGGSVFWCGMYFRY